MVLLYFFENNIEYHGMTSKELYKLWLKHAGAAFQLYNQGIMKYAFKVSQSDNSDLKSFFNWRNTTFWTDKNKPTRMNGLSKPICNAVTPFKLAA